MESLNPSPNAPMKSAHEHQLGEELIYGMHGKCAISGVEARTIANESIRFYKLEIRRSTLSRSTRQEPAIWVPVAKARELGLRTKTSQSDLDAIMAVFSSREYYLDTALPWSSTAPKIEELVRSEGALGLAKAISYLHVLKSRLVVAPSELNRMYETVTRLLFREISEITGETLRAIEERVIKVMRPKLRPDN